MRPPLGYRFLPTDEELIADFLYKKVNGSLGPITDVVDCDIYGEERRWTALFREKESSDGGDDDTSMYFFTRLRKKVNEKGKRVGRVTDSGTWKTQRDDAVLIPGSKIQIGSKRSFKFVPNEKNPANMRRWIMHEFRIDGRLLEKIEGCGYDTSCVICRIKAERQKKRDG